MFYKCELGGVVRNCCGDLFHRSSVMRRGLCFQTTPVNQVFCRTYFIGSELWHGKQDFKIRGILDYRFWRREISEKNRIPFGIKLQKKSQMFPLNEIWLPSYLTLSDITCEWLWFSFGSYRNSLPLAPRLFHLSLICPRNFRQNQTTLADWWLKWKSCQV